MIAMSVLLILIRWIDEIVRRKAVVGLFKHIARLRGMSFDEYLCEFAKNTGLISESGKILPLRTNNYFLGFLLCSLLLAMASALELNSGKYFFAATSAYCSLLIYFMCASMIQANFTYRKSKEYGLL